MAQARKDQARSQMRQVEGQTELAKWLNMSAVTPFDREVIGSPLWAKLEQAENHMRWPNYPGCEESDISDNKVEAFREGYRDALYEVRRQMFNIACDPQGSTGPGHMPEQLPAVVEWTSQAIPVEGNRVQANDSGHIWRIVQAEAAGTCWLRGQTDPKQTLEVNISEMKACFTLLSN